MFLRMLALAAIATQLTACSNLVKVIEDEFDVSIKKVERVKDIPAKTEAKSAPIVEHQDGMWIARGAVKMETVDTLPKLFEQTVTFDRTVTSLSEFAQRLTVRANVVVQVTPDAIAAAQRATQPARADQAAGGLRAPQALPAGPVGPAPTLINGPGAAAAPTPVHIAYAEGSLKGLLDMVAARFDVSWRHVDGGIQFYYTDTRTFQIKALPGDTQVSATVSNSSSGGQSGSTGGGGDSTGTSKSANAQNIAVSSKLSVFDSLEKAVSAMLSPYGRVVSSPATGTISVTDTPEVLKRVGKFIDDENKSMSRQVMINVTVLAVSANDLDDYGINWNLVYGELSTRYGIKSNYSSQSGALSFSAAVLDTATSKLAGSTLMMSALSSQGKVRRETSASVATLNNQPVPVQVARQTSYLKSSSTSQTANVGSTTTLDPGTVTSGFNMMILPHVLTDGTVLLQFGTDISSLRSIRTVTSGAGGNSIETPEIDTRNFLQRVAMKSGETLVISGFEQTDGNLDRKGVGDPRFALLGGGVTARTNKEVIVILVTPIAMGGA